MTQDYINFVGLSNLLCELARYNRYRRFDTRQNGHLIVTTHNG